MRRSREVPPGFEEWAASGRHEQVLGHAVFVRDLPAQRPSDQPPVVLLHGFPGSSHDWAGVSPALGASRRVLTLDLPGYGLSTKPADGDYSLFSQADVVEAVLADHGVTACSLVAHDMGDTVAAELMARHNAGGAALDIGHVVLTNGSIFIDQARLTRGQRLTLRLPARALPVSLPGVILRRSLLESFGVDAPPPPGAIDDLVAMIGHRGGDRLLPKLIRYIEERREHQQRWTDALVDHPGPLSVAWGEQDPIAVLAMVHRLADLRPDITVRTFSHLGHWPSIEDPAAVSAVLRDLLG